MTDARPRSRPRLLLLSMYPLDRGSWGPTVRIGHLRDALATRVELDVVAGYRRPRRLALARYAASGRLRGLAGVYVESSSFLPAEVDLAVLGLARALGTRVLTYVRDAYQLFPDEYPRRSFRQRLGAAAFSPAVRALAAVSTSLAFPTRGLASAVLGTGAPAVVLLPPGAPAPVERPRDPGARRLLFVGDARLPVHGTGRLVQAVGLARDRGADIELVVVCRPGQEPPGPLPAWVELRRAEGSAIHDLLPGVLATVVPRPRTPYNDLALPVKLYEYLAYGRPILATDCVEQAAVVRGAGAGIVVPDSVEALAGGIVEIASSSEARWNGWSRAAHRAARAASWDLRAEQIVALLTTGR